MELKIPIEVVFDDVKSVIDELNELQKYKLGEGDDMTLVDVDDVADVLTRHIKARDAQRGADWIPCSERLPKEIGTYMATVDYGKYGRTVWRMHYRGTGQGWEDDCVVAWMPMPEPYKEGEDE